MDHAPLVVSFKADPTAVAAGTYDAYFANWYATAPRDRAIWWTFYHEPEDDITAGAFTAADYRAAWSRLASLAAQADNSQLRATLILMCWTVNPHSGRDWNDYYARGSVQALGWDCYNKGARKGVYQASSALLANAVATSNEARLPWGIAEMGSILVTGDAARAEPPGSRPWPAC